MYNICTWTNFYFYVSCCKLQNDHLHQNSTLNTSKLCIICYQLGERCTAENGFKDI